jgi:hypothetical protein
MMRKRLTGSILLSLCLTAFYAASCGADSQGNVSGEVPRVTWGDESGGARLGIVVMNTKRLATEPVWVHAVLKNVSDGQLLLWVTNSSYDYAINVAYSNGKPVPLTRHGYLDREFAPGGSATRFRLDPGATESASFLLNRLFDMSVTGTYKIGVSRGVNANGGVVVVRSPEVTVEVSDPPVPPVPASIDVPEK